MKVIFDIDDTITNETEFMKRYAPSYIKKKFNIDVEIKDSNGYNINEVYGLRETLEKEGLPEEKINTNLEKITNGFWSSHFLKYMVYPIKKDTSKIIEQLYKDGYKVEFVSHRGKKTKEKEGFKDKLIRLKIVPLLTRFQLGINKIKYDKLTLVETVEEKVNYINNEKSSLVFEDQASIINMISDFIKVVCVKTQHNENINFNRENIVKVSFEYSDVMDCLKDLKKGSLKPKQRKQKIKGLILYNKLFTELFYVLARNMTKRKIIKTFNPLVIGKENLPKEKGANIFVGNHRNVKDPLIAIAMLKNPVHFAALKRMFENGENIFGIVGKNAGTIATTFFVKAIGALPIARSSDKNYRLINLQTFSYFKDYLELNSGIVFYPEGTLNKNPKENGNILPLKSKKIFKLAENGKAVIRPMAIVWTSKNSNIDNKVIISFLKPIYTDGLQEIEIANKWFTSVNEEINSINYIVNELEKEKNNKVKVLSSNVRKINCLKNCYTNFDEFS